jgi:hypothetical protein
VASPGPSFPRRVGALAGLSGECPVNCSEFEYADSHIHYRASLFWALVGYVLLR